MKRIVDSCRRFATPPGGFLLVFSLFWGVLAIRLAVKASITGSITLGIEAVGFLVVGLLLWVRSPWALIANAALGLCLLGVGLYQFISLEKWWNIVNGIGILGSHFAFRDEIAKHARAGRGDAERLPTHGTGLCLALLRDGWKSHRFPKSNVVVALPYDFAAAFDGDGVLMGTTNGRDPNFSATLHALEQFVADPRAAYRFVEHLARKSSVEPIDKGTYRYFKEPDTKGDGALGYTFYAIAIPGSIVVISIASQLGEDRPAFLARIESAIPDLVGELV